MDPPPPGCWKKALKTSFSSPAFEKLWGGFSPQSLGGFQALFNLFPKGFIMGSPPRNFWADDRMVG